MGGEKGPHAAAAAVAAPVAAAVVAQVSVARVALVRVCLRPPLLPSFVYAHCYYNLYYLLQIVSMSTSISYSPFVLRGMWDGKKRGQGSVKGRTRRVTTAMTLASVSLPSATTGSQTSNTAPTTRTSLHTLLSLHY